MVCLEAQNPNKEAPSLLFLSLPVVWTIGVMNHRDNTDDVGVVSKRWVLTPPKGLGTISTQKLRSSRLCATLAQGIGLSRNIAVTTSKAFLQP
jgi:hypothetical protein